MTQDHTKLDIWSRNMKEAQEALPQMILIAVLVINLITALIDSDRNSKASLILTIILVALTYWGGFYKPLIDFLTAKI
jgi:hypothetical protein